MNANKTRHTHVKHAHEQELSVKHISQVLKLEQYYTVIVYVHTIIGNLYLIYTIKSDK